MKYFILDFDDGPDGFITNCVNALRLATRNEPTEIIQFGRNDHVKHSSQDEFFEHIVGQLRGADIIIGFSDRNMIGYLNNTAGFRKTLFEKIDSRTPFFFQFMNIWEMYYSPNNIYERNSNYYTSFLEHLDIHPTGIRVYNSDASEYYLKYTPKFEPVKTDSSISDVFEDGEGVWIFEPNLMTFGEGNAALLKSSNGNHHDTTIDPGAGLPDFEKHSPFVVRKTEKNFGYFVSGTFMAINFHHIAKTTAVPEANIAAISNLVRELQSNVRVTTDA